MKKKMKLYEGQIVHTKETIRCLYKVTYNKYELKKVIVRMLVGAFLTIVGLIGIDSYILQAGLLLIGCWLLVSKDFPAVCKADRAVEARKHMLPIISTVFYDDIVELSSKSCMEMEYGQFKFLFE
ncbi:MAG: hypothetical protein PWP24_826 [Clostridiales bacterium]|nr:hypothetical protein [Clostridiales bacterium]